MVNGKVFGFHRQVTATTCQVALYNQEGRVTKSIHFDGQGKEITESEYNQLFKAQLQLNQSLEAKRSGQPAVDVSSIVVVVEEDDN